jgi:hypothetical protein
LDCNQVFDWVLPVTPGHNFSYFFINPTRFQPQVGRVSGRPVGPGRAGFKKYEKRRFVTPLFFFFSWENVPFENVFAIFHF